MCVERKRESVFHIHDTYTNINSLDIVYQLCTLGLKGEP